MVEKVMPMARFAAMVDSLTGALCGRAPGESVTEVVGRWIRTDGQCADRDLKELQQRMFAANPELNALRNTLMADPITKGAELIAIDTGAAPGDPGPRIAAVTAGAVVLQLSEIPPGPQKDEAITAAMFLASACLIASSEPPMYSTYFRPAASGGRACKLTGFPSYQLMYR